MSETRDYVKEARMLSATFQTTYAKKHNGEGMGVIEADGVAMKATAQKLAEFVESAVQSARNEALTEAENSLLAIKYPYPVLGGPQGVIDNCLAKVRALKTEAPK